MSFKAVDMTKIGDKVVSRLTTKVKREFGEVSKEPEFTYGVEVGPDGVGSIIVEFCDLMDQFIALSAKRTLENIILEDPNTAYHDSSTTRPGFRDFRLGAMPCAYVIFRLRA